MFEDYIQKILAAPVYDVAIQSPLEYAPLFSAQTARKVWFKREDKQPIFSFKIRGAYTKIAALDDKGRRHGVIAASAGNHAQGVALAAKILETPATIVMPVITPEIKIRAVKNHGAEIILHGDTLADALVYAKKLAQRKKLTFVHLFDDADVIAGQGTIGMEILNQHPDPIEAIFVPIGGGGLIAGIAAYVKYIRPEIKIIGVEPEDSDCMYQALKAGHPVALKNVGIFADGVAVSQAGEKTFRIVRECVDEILHVSNDEMCVAIKDIFSDTRAIVEPSGALGVAGIRKYLEKRRSRKNTGDLVALVSGANVDFGRLRYIADRTNALEKRELFLAVTMPERPGILHKLCELVGKRTISDFDYRYYASDKARVFLGLQVQDYHKEAKPLIRKLKAQKFSVMDMTDNQLAREHVRYMIGSTSPKLKNELLYRFEFQERPGALLKFLGAISHGWNISLLHYRNHGAAWSRVLVGIEIPKAEHSKFKKLIREMNFESFDETHNPAYRVFLKN